MVMVGNATHTRLASTGFDESPVLCHLELALIGCVDFACADGAPKGHSPLF